MVMQNERYILEINEELEIIAHDENYEEYYEVVYCAEDYYESRDVLTYIINKNTTYAISKYNALKFTPDFNDERDFKLVNRAEYFVFELTTDDKSRDCVEVILEDDRKNLLLRVCFDTYEEAEKYLFMYFEDIREAYQEEYGM